MPATWSSAARRSASFARPRHPYTQRAQARHARARGRAPAARVAARHHAGDRGAGRHAGLPLRHPLSRRRSRLRRRAAAARRNRRRSLGPLRRCLPRHGGRTDCGRDGAAPARAAGRRAAAAPRGARQGLSRPTQRAVVAAPPPSRSAASSFAIHAGEAVGVVGESGSGKSTLARLVMGLEAPSAGRILLDGSDVTAPESAWQQRIRAVQMVFQDPVSALNPRRRVANLVTQSLEAKANWQSRARASRTRARAACATPDCRRNSRRAFRRN